MNTNNLTKTVNMAKQGDRKAFGELYETYYDIIYKFVLKKVSNKETAEDITQEIFIQSFEGIGLLNEPEKYLSWLYSIADHKCADYFRLKSKNFEVSEEQAASSEYAAFPFNTIMLPDDYCVNSESADKLKEILNSLKPDMKKVLILYYYDELSLSAIAKKLKVSENTIKQKLYRARKRLCCEIKKLEKNGAAFALVPMREFLHNTVEESAAVKSRSLLTSGTQIAAAKISGIIIAASLAVSVPIGLYFTEHELNDRNNDSVIIEENSSINNDSSNIQLVKIPNLVNLSPQEAEKRLSDIGLKSEIRKIEQFFPLGRITFTAPFGGYELPYGDTVILYECVNNWGIDEELLSKADDTVPENYYSPGEYFFKTYEINNIPDDISDEKPPYDRISFDMRVTDELKSFGICQMKIKYEGKTDNKYADIEFDFSDYEDDIYIWLALDNAPHSAELYFKSSERNDTLEYGTYYFDYQNNVAYLHRNN